MRATIAILIVSILGGCGSDEPSAPVKSGTTPVTIDFNELQQNPTLESEEQPVYTNDKRFHKALLAAVENYAEAYGNIDDLMRWAPGMCRVPTIKIRESASEHDGTHGRKLYWLYAKDRPAYYLASKGAQQPVGQVLVKEAFVAEPGEAQGEPEKLGHQPLVTTIERDGTPYHAGAKQALYVMRKLDPKTKGTDDGWIYGTLTPDGATVTSAGRVASCMQCHTKGTSDRMFGLPAN